MYIVTNREIYDRRDGFRKFGKQPSAKGPNELRLVEITGSRANPKLNVIADKLTSDQKKKLGVPKDEEAFASQLIARSVFNRLQKSGKNLLLFVHGFNNDVESVVNRSLRLEEQYGVEVLPFSWPANGGGARGVLSYKSDKKDSSASVGALDRVLDKVGGYLRALREEAARRVRESATKRFDANAESRDEFIAKALEQQCSVRVSLLLHSMGNYLFKQLMKSSIYSGEELIFDNVVMASADANNENHREWVDRIQFRNRLYITINENDSALKLSRAKLGSAQKARLGHFPYQLDSARAVYVNFTDAKFVGDSHAYFEGTAMRNAAVKSFFKQALNGNVAEKGLAFDVATNLHTLS